MSSCTSRPLSFSVTSTMQTRAEATTSTCVRAANSGNYRQENGLTGWKRLPLCRKPARQCLFLFWIRLGLAASPRQLEDSLDLPAHDGFDSQHLSALYDRSHFWRIRDLFQQQQQLVFVHHSELVRLAPDRFQAPDGLLPGRVDNRHRSDHYCLLSLRLGLRLRRRRAQHDLERHCRRRGDFVFRFSSRLRELGGSDEFHQCECRSRYPRTGDCRFGGAFGLSYPNELGFVRSQSWRHGRTRPRSHHGPGSRLLNAAPRNSTHAQTQLATVPAQPRRHSGLEPRPTNFQQTLFPSCLNRTFFATGSIDLEHGG